MCVVKSELFVESLSKISSLAGRYGAKLYIVGGFVRDWLFYLKQNKLIRSFEDLRYCNLFEFSGFVDFIELKLNKEDLDVDIVFVGNALDFVYSFSPNDNIQIEQVFNEFGTAKFKDLDCGFVKYEIASTRSEIYKKPAAFPTVTFIDNITKDIVRRDFTINSLMIDLLPNIFGRLFTLGTSLEDFSQGLIKVFHDLSFIDDPTRILRAWRLKIQFSFEIEAHTQNLINQAISHPDFKKWKKKRKSRFVLELSKIAEYQDRDLIFWRQINTLLDDY